MVKLISIIVSTSMIIAFAVVSFVFVDRFLFQKETLIRNVNGDVNVTDDKEKVLISLSAASEKFEMRKPVVTNGTLSIKDNRNSLTRYLETLEDKRRVTKLSNAVNNEQKPNELTIVLAEKLSDVYVQGIRSELMQRGFDDIDIRKDSEKILIYGLKNAKEQQNIANILSFSYFLDPILGGPK